MQPAAAPLVMHMHGYIRGVATVSVTFNERFVQCFAFCTQVLGTYLAVACLTKSSSHTSLVLTNLGLVITRVGPTNFG